MELSIKIDDQEISATEGENILEAADRAGIYIPRLCFKPGLPSSHELHPSEDGIYRQGQRITSDSDDTFQGCQLCIVEIEGRAGEHTSCDTEVFEGMVVRTKTQGLLSKRQEHLEEILKDHPHVCLTCAQKEGCSRTQCSSNVPDDEKCCVQLGNCELEKVAYFVGIRDSTPKYIPKHLPLDDSESLIVRDYNYCIGCLRCVRACTEVSGADVLGFVYSDGKVQVGPGKAFGFSESDCRFCGVCVEVCPTGALLDKDLKSGEKHSVLVPCRNNCPAEVDVPRYIEYIMLGKYGKAAAVVREKVPFPGVLGRVCFHPCEEECRRTEINEPVSICSLKRFCADEDTGEWKEVAANASEREKTGKSVAVVGAGPAGLTASYYLARKGHYVKIFEAEEVLGGMMALGIPKYRLPDNVLQQEINEIIAEGIEVRRGTRVGVDISLSELKNKNDAVFLAVGAPQSRKLDIEGNELPGVQWGIDFLRSVNLGEDVNIDKNVLVIGGGNVAIDVAMTAKRMGAENVRIACLEKREEMPAFPWEIKEAVDEGIGIHCSWGPKKIIGSGEKVSALEMKRCTSVFDGDGKFSPTYDEKEITTIEADTVIIAIGQQSDLAFISDVPEIRALRGCIRVSENSLEAAHGIFAGGDIVTIPGTVIDAIAAGRKAATSIDLHLGGDGNIDEVLCVDDDIEIFQKMDVLENFAKLGRTHMPIMDAEDRKGFEEFYLGFDEAGALSEARRCLRCELRFRLPPVLLPPESLLAFNEENIMGLPDGIEGVYQLLDEDKKILAIVGTSDIKGDLLDRLDSVEKTRYFKYDEDRMYSKRESELMQVYLQKHGAMPPGDGGGDDDLDDLF